MTMAKTTSIMKALTVSLDECSGRVLMHNGQSIVNGGFCYILC
jgi:hypothetical protein